VVAKRQRVAAVLLTAATDPELAASGRGGGGGGGLLGGCAVSCGWLCPVWVVVVLTAATDPELTASGRGERGGGEQNDMHARLLMATHHMIPLVRTNSYIGSPAVISSRPSTTA
jgi:hypothetical protein